MNKPWLTRTMLSQDPKPDSQLSNPGNHGLAVLPSRDLVAPQVFGDGVRVLVGRGVPRLLHLAELAPHFSRNRWKGERSSLAGSALRTRPDDSPRPVSEACPQSTCLPSALLGQGPLGPRRLSGHERFGMSNEQHLRHHVILAWSKGLTARTSSTGCRRDDGTDRLFGRPCREIGTSSTTSTFGKRRIEQQDLLLVRRLKESLPTLQSEPVSLAKRSTHPTRCDVPLARSTAPRVHRGNGVRLPPPGLGPRVVSHPVRLAPSGPTPESRSGPGRGDPAQEPTTDLRDGLETLHPTDRRPVASPTRPCPT